MKKIIITALIAAITATTILMNMAVKHNENNYYPIAAKVVQQNGNNVTLEDTRGYLWDMKSEDLYTGDTVLCVMNSKGDYDVTNDTIVTCRYFN